MTLSVLHLAGSAVSEFMGDLSVLYAQDCLQATADPDLYRFHVAYVTPDLKWRFPTDLSRAAIDAAPPMGLTAAIECLTAMNLDVVVPQMFCLPGMTSYRALLDVLGLRYVGNSWDVMALGADKARTREVVAAAGVPVPSAEVLREGEQPSLPLPVVVKPVASDNSVGVTLVCRQSELDQALRTGFEHGEQVLVESYVPLGREVRCGVIELEGELVALPLEEYAVDPVTNPIRGYEDKITRGAGGSLSLVAKDVTRAWTVEADDPINQRVSELAIKAHRALGCRHYSLFDFRIDRHGQPWFLEAGLYCSFARASVISTMAQAADVSVGELFAAVLHEALAH